MTKMNRLLWGYSLAVVVAALDVESASFPVAYPIPGDAHKQVVTTSWWPAGTEKKAESVGIISYGFVFMTAMMENNDTLLETAEAELSDIRDIAHAAGATMSDLVDCLVNAPSGGAEHTKAKFREAFQKVLPDKMELPALTVVEAPGEYAFFNSSITCVAALPSSEGRSSRKIIKLSSPGTAYGALARGLLHFTVDSASIADALSESSKLIQKAGGKGNSDLAECTVFLKDIKASKDFRRALGETDAALTIVQAGLSPGKVVTLRCVANTGADMQEGTSGNKEVKVAHKLVFAPGIYSKRTDGADAFEALDKALQSVGAGLSDVVSCLFFVKDQWKVFDLFKGFAQAFNHDHPPPPTRDELQAVGEIPDTNVVMRCVAALPLKETTVPEKESLVI
eukprot:CAMPEP_0206493428 /NCGR_PEP_ID=MMETSP0324_2-20121206/46956_1 /ASSEMBLY_ACC=CAM_ASM_000836 /TAXON_ID=2866 /ORGANISM="Crypthecodinium cohnii, Strain Seligo" /LENGTH=394 /DNA_ID=CAMNT_0053976549 /DNA_START=31 /DNA_END=1215 /DNA_ORIENTATION=+